MLAREDVLVIGAGPAGIASAYYLQQAGISYRVVDQASVIASTWHNLYPSLRLNTTRFFSHLPRQRFPLRYGIFPSGRQYYDYLLDFVARQRLNIHLNVQVKQVQQVGAYWQVETSEGTFLYKAVISASGIYSRPVFPQLEGMNDFQGTLIHAHEFKHPHQTTAKKLLVIGNGPSGVDIAVACQSVAECVAMTVRNGMSMYRRYPYGLPVHVWLLLFLLLPKQWCNWLMKRFTKIEFAEQERYGIPKPPKGQAAVTAYMGRELLDAVKAQQVTIVPEPRRFLPHAVEFTDGSCREFDMVILATGYEPALHDYLAVPLQFDHTDWAAPAACAWEIGPNGQRGFPLLDRTQHPNGRQVVGYAGLYVVGVYYKGKGAMYNMNVEAAIAAEQIQMYLRQGNFTYDH